MDFIFTTTTITTRINSNIQTSPTMLYAWRKKFILRMTKFSSVSSSSEHYMCNFPFKFHEVNGTHDQPRNWSPHCIKKYTLEICYKEQQKSSFEVWYRDRGVCFSVVKKMLSKKDEAKSCNRSSTKKKHFNGVFLCFICYKKGPTRSTPKITEPRSMTKTSNNHRLGSDQPLYPFVQGD